jgi:DNA-binding MarR family transcriptional regulator
MENFKYQIHGITNMPNLSASEKLVMIHLHTLKEMGINESHVETSSRMLSYTRHGYLKILKRLIKMGYVNQIKRGLYELNEVNVF